MNDFDAPQDALLERALHELPVAPLPLDFDAHVLAAIQPLARREAAPAARPTRFHFQFLDIVLALSWSLVLMIVWITVLWWTGLYSPKWIPPAQLGVSMLEQFFVSNPGLLLLVIVLVTLELSILGLLGINLFGDRSEMIFD